MFLPIGTAVLWAAWQRGYGMIRSDALGTFVTGSPQCDPSTLIAWMTTYILTRFLRCERIPDIAV